MKYKILITIVLITILNCQAQRPILPLTELASITPVENAYYKDTNSELNEFVGTWLYTNGNTSLKIKLTKRTMVPEVKYYEDLLVGGYDYIENGVQKISNLSDADNQNFNEDYNAVIYGNSIHKSCVYLPFDDCVEGQSRLILLFDDPTSEEHVGNMVLKRVISSGQETLRGFIIFNYYGTYALGVETPAPILPWQQEYLFIKQ